MSTFRIAVVPLFAAEASPLLGALVARARPVHWKCVGKEGSTSLLFATQPPTVHSRDDARLVFFGNSKGTTSQHRRGAVILLCRLNCLRQSAACLDKAVREFRRCERRKLTPFLLIEHDGASGASVDQSLAARGVDKRRVHRLLTPVGGSVHGKDLAFVRRMLWTWESMW